MNTSSTIPLLLFVAAILAAATASAQTLEPVAALVVGRASADGTWTDSPTNARVDDAATLAVVVKAREGRRHVVYVADDAVAPLEIAGHTIADDDRRSWDLLGTTSVRWSFVEPHAWRPEGETAPNGATTPYYSNVVSGGEHHGDWLGWDRVSYFATPIDDWSSDSSSRLRPATARPPRAADDVWLGLGTIRYQVELRLDDADGTILASPGPDEVDTYGITAAVHRVSIRRDDTYLGWLTSFFMVPEIFGSAGPGANHQTDRFIGADCADILIGALHAQGYRDVPYTSVASLTSWATVVAGPADLDEHGVPVDGDLTGVLPGDVIRIDYAGDYAGLTPRSWDHVAVLYEDRSDPEGPLEGRADGKLDGFDLVAHMGHPQLKVEPLGDQCPMRLDVLRWDPDKM
jgi:hypothetical protein